MMICIEGLNINYDICGSGSDILFLHGWGSSLDAFNRMILPIKDKFRCIRIDLPGAGKSSLPENPLTLEDYCRIVLSFMNQLELKNPIMIAHSHGARITLNMCAEHMVNPEKIVLFGAAGIPSKKTTRQKIRQSTFKAIRRTLTLPGVKYFTADLLDAARNHFGSADYNAAPPVMRQTLVNVVNTDVTDKLKDITAETLLVFGEKDTATPVWQAKIMEQEIPNSGLCIIDDATHWCFIERPSQIDAILNVFLGGKA